MRNDYEARLKAIEDRLNDLARRLDKQAELAGQTRQNVFSNFPANAALNGQVAGVFAVTPVGGIPAATLSAGVYTPGSASCELYKVSAGTIVDASTTITVYNGVTSGAVGGSKLVLCLYVAGLPFVVVEPC